jgi:hypothetical protein
MTIREITAAELVTAPRFDAREALALGTQIAAVAREERAKPGVAIPPPIERALVGLEERRSVVEGALVALPPPVDTARRRRADRRVDAFHAGLSTFLAAFSRLPPDVEEAAEASRVASILYPEGLAFTQATFRREWAESKVVLERIAKDGLEPILRRLGAGIFLDGLVAAQREYGDALGVTQPPEAPPETVALREPLDAFRASLERYILVTAAYGEDDAVAGAKALARALLRPIAELASRTSGSGAVDPSEVDTVEEVLPEEEETTEPVPA